MLLLLHRSVLSQLMQLWTFEPFLSKADRFSSLRNLYGLRPDFENIGKRLHKPESAEM